MRRILIFVMLGFSWRAWAATYYVSSSLGSDANYGTSSSAPWQTLAEVNSHTFLGGDSILFKRGDVWNESLTVPSSGSSGNPIAFDAYGNGPAPNFTGYYAVPSSAWVPVTGNAWKAAVPLTFTTVNFCLFGSVWGQKVGALSSNLTAKGNFYLANGFVYVYATSNPGTFYNGAAIVPMALSNVPVINVNGKSWLTFQHILVNWFDQYGVYVQGASDHLVFANMEADSMIPQGTQPLGFYVNETSPGAGDIKIYNDEAHLNYDGFRFDGAASAIAMVNDKAYANRDSALVDNTGAVIYSYCHFYASSLAVAGSTDVLSTSGPGPAAGAGNVAGDVPPAVQAYQRYPAQISLTVDDIGMTPGADSYYATQVLPAADAAGVPVGTAITVGYTARITPIISEIQGWINGGRDVTSHSVSHNYYTNTDALDIQYTGSGTAATLNISGKVLTIAVTGASDSVSYNLGQGQPQGTLLGLQQALQATGKFSWVFPLPCQGPYGTGCSAYTAEALLSQDLADVAAQDVRGSVYHMLLDVTRLTTDEIALSRQWMTVNLTGLPGVPVYVYPGGYETTAMQGIAAGVPYSGARGALKEDLGVKDTYADGFNVQNITSFGVNPSWMGLPPTSLNQKIQALLWKQSVWGVPWGIFWHNNELTQSDPVGGTEITNLVQDFKNDGATIQTNTALVSWLLAGTRETGTDGNAYYTIPATSMALDFRPTKSSPVVDAGQNLGAAYALDINGVNQNSNGAGWEIGAHVFQGYAVYGGGSPGSFFEVGENRSQGCAAGAPCSTVELPQNWVNSNEWQGTTTYTVNFPGSGAGGSWICGTTAYGPYTASSLASLQQVANDAEACRKAAGTGTLIIIPPSNLFVGSAGLVLPQTAGDNGGNFIVFTSSTPLPVNRTVCSHGTQDNVVESAQPGLRNPGCNGTALSYQNGTPTITSVASGPFSLANGTATTTAAYNDLASMWSLEYTGGAQGISAGIGADNSPAHHFAFVNGHIFPQPCTYSAGPPPTCTGGNSFSVSPIKIASIPVPSVTGPGDLNSHIHFRGMYISSDWTDATSAGYPVGSNSMANAFNLESCSYCSVLYSYTDRILDPGSESHQIQMGYTMTAKIAHNWFEGASIGSFCGGYGAALLWTSVDECTDIEDRGNRYTYPYSWMTAFEAGFRPNNGSNGYVRKNASEIKSASRYLRDGNIYENVDDSGAQNGTAFTAKVSQCNGGLGCNNYQLTTANLTMTNNIYRDTCNGPSFGDPGGLIDGGGVSLGVRNVLFQNNLGYEVGNFVPGGCVGTTPTYAIRVGPGEIAWSGCAASSSAIVNVDGTTAITLSCPGQAGGLQLDMTNGDPVVTTGCTDASFNTSPVGIGPAAFGTSPASLQVSYSVAGATLGESGVTCTFVTGTGKPFFTTLAHNTFVAEQASAAPAICIYDSYQATLTGIPAPQPYYSMRNSNYVNNLCAAYGVESLGSAGLFSSVGEGTRSESTIWDATTFQFHHNVVASRALHGALNCAVSGGNNVCTLVTGDAPNGQGSRMKNGLVLVNGASFGPPTAVSATSMTFATGSGPGTVTNANYFWADYTEYGGGAAGAQPPVTVTFPSNVSCTGNDPTLESCVGLTGAMSTTSYPLDLADWHGYGLCHTGNASCNGNASLYAAGGPDQGSDGTDIGISVASVDAAQTQTVYVCESPCGFSGPYSDVPQAPATLFGFDETNTAASNFPTVNYGMQRFWDSPPLQWPSINTGSGVFNFTNLDAMLTQSFANGIKQSMYTLARTPTWASARPTDTSCAYTGTGPGQGNGECDPPSDLSSDGSGANAIWKAWITAIAQHVNDPTYLLTHTHIKFWEIWNEPDSSSPKFWAGSFAQLARLTEDANCIITGRGVIHQSGNGAATACSATAIDPTAQIVMASAHAVGVALTYGRNELYCSNTAGIPSSQLPCPNPANATAQAVDIINFHMKPGNESGNNCPAPLPCTPESAMAWYAANIQSVLQQGELAKPLWDAEGAYSTSGFTGAYTDPDMASSFIPRFYLTDWSLGISGIAWYSWDQLATEPLQVQTAYEQTYGWLQNASLIQPCTAVGTVWSCSIYKNGLSYLILWDTSKSCSAGSCTTGSQSVATRWKQVQDMTSASLPVNISGNAVMVGIKPLILH